MFLFKSYIFAPSPQPRLCIYMTLLSWEQKTKSVRTIDIDSLSQNQQIFKPIFLIRVGVIEHFKNVFTAWHKKKFPL